MEHENWAREQYSLLVDNVEEYAIFAMDVDRRITTWNPGVERILGYCKHEFIGQSADIIFLPDDQAAGAPETEVQQAQAMGEARDERWHMRKDGRHFWGTGMMIALYTPERELRGFAKILRDNTERKQAEEALRDREQQLQRLNQQLHEANTLLEKRVQARSRQVRQLALELTSAEQQERRRIARVLHDHLQQILYGVQFRVHALRNSVSEDKLAALEKLDTLVGEAIRATRTLMVELTPPILEGGGLIEAIEWVIDQMQVLHNLQVALEVEDHPRVPQGTLGTLIFQIVRELLFNVVKHAGVDCAAIVLRQQGDWLLITVTDQGQGFDVAPVLSRVRPRGLGIASIRKRLEFIGGKIEIESGPGRGTRVTISAPLAPAGSGEPDSGISS